mmetsp:Transcript_13248/g.17169  ORF Transcript_13248/g.17169 Transcript_13248/m.17169 type:complete len:156 (-) Transcript_13248:354-821(-)
MQPHPTTPQKNKKPANSSAKSKGKGKKKATELSPGIIPQQPPLGFDAGGVPMMSSVPAIHVGVRHPNMQVRNNMPVPNMQTPPTVRGQFPRYPYAVQVPDPVYNMAPMEYGGPRNYMPHHMQFQHHQQQYAQMFHNTPNGGASEDPTPDDLSNLL